jgi:hypothetical protein
MSIRVTLNKLESAGPKQTTFVNQACDLLEKALNHKEFMTRVRMAEYTASLQRVPGVGDVERSQQEVAQIILLGLESQTSADYEIDLHIRLRKFKPWQRYVVGETSLGRFPIMTNYRFINRWMDDGDAISLAAHIMHEWMHVAGFFHQGGNSARGDVAYVIGNIVHEVIEEFITDKEMNDEALMF